MLPNFRNYVIREVFEQATKKIKNALREGIIRFYAKLGRKFTKKQSMQIIENLNIPDNILNLEVPLLSKEEFLNLYMKIPEKSIS